VRKIKEKYPEALTDFIMRVDCFEVQSTLILGGDDGSEETTIVELKLNEVESFDANYQIDFHLNRSEKLKKKAKRSTDPPEEREYQLDILQDRGSFSPSSSSSTAHSYKDENLQEQWKQWDDSKTVSFLTNFWIKKINHLLDVAAIAISSSS
jgi:hypothetical protein